jgi:hypothetical protein
VVSSFGNLVLSRGNLTKPWYREFGESDYSQTVRLERTFNAVKHSFYHSFRRNTIKQLLYCIQITSILHTSLFFRRSNLNAMWIYLLRRKGNNGRGDIVKAVERSEVSVPVNWYQYAVQNQRTKAYFDKASKSTVAYGVTPPATPRSILRKTTTFCI